MARSKSTKRYTALSLFTSGGIGDLALRESGFDILVSSELLPDRHAVFEFNFPDTLAVTGDIWDHLDEIEEATRSALDGRPLDLFYATPPCQGMSKNGRGKLLNGMRAGRKPTLDERNRLIIPTVELAVRLRPETLLFENVPEMESTLIVDDHGKPTQILDFIENQLGDEYTGKAEVIEFANFGVPQCRKRLISIYSKVPQLGEWLSTFGSLIPPATHSPDGRNGTRKWTTVRDVIEGLPALDANSADAATSDHPFHRVPLLDEMKYWWVSNTPCSRSAFDNQCVECGFMENPTHSARRDANGINRASRETPLYCVECSALLPRPSVERDGSRELMRGYTSAYKRMSYDKPASALTRNLSYACSDNKLHPQQNRVLSLYEAFLIHTIDQFDYEWRRDDQRKVSDKTVREIIGESIPPAGLQTIVEHLVRIQEDRASLVRQEILGPLFMAS